MEDFRIKSRCAKICYEFKAFTKSMGAALYKPDFQKVSMCSVIKRPGWAFVTKHTAEPLKQSGKLLKQSAELLKA